MTGLLLVALLASGGTFTVTADYAQTHAISWSQSSDRWALRGHTERKVADYSSWGIALAEGADYGIHAWKTHTKICAATKTAITAASVQGLKRLVGRERPDHSDKKSWPSGHAAYSALMMPEGSGWYVLLPVAVSAGRVLAARHDWLDVASGAAIGFGLRALPCG